MSEHHLNGAAKAKGQQTLGLIDLGDSIGFIGFKVEPIGATDKDGNEFMVAGLFAVGGRVSSISLQTQFRSVFIGELHSIKVADLKRLLSEEATGNDDSKAP
jgi:hypothetical protein